MITILMMMMLTGVIMMIIAIASYMYVMYVSWPSRIRSMLHSQGISGPSPSLFFGNLPQIQHIMASNHPSTSSMHHDHHDGDGHHHDVSHDWASTMFPHLKLWKHQYGSVFMYSSGSIQILSITDPEMVKEISLCTSLDLGKPSYLSKDRGPLLGNGILSSSGHFWAFQRKIISPEFYPDKVKGMMGCLVEAITTTVSRWEDKINASGGTATIIVDEDLRHLSADIISRAAFGCHYSRGKEIFSKLRVLQKLMANTPFVGIPGSRFMPTKINREIGKLERGISKEIVKVVKERMEAQQEKDFLQIILEATDTWDNSKFMEKLDREKFIVDNCKNIYFAGHETTATTAAWALMLLAAHPDWQGRAREEVVEICGHGGVPNAETLRNMKVLTMIIQETLRLYPPATFVVRGVLKDTTLKGIKIPKGTTIQIPIPFLQQDPLFWGQDALQFNPQRFAHGTAGACMAPQVYMPFGLGTRVCLGQHFAIVKLKFILALILAKFSFSLSPEYVHHAAFRLVIEPQHGVSLQMRKV